MRMHRVLATSLSWASLAWLAFTFVACTGIVGITDLPPATDESSSSFQSSNGSSQGGSTASHSGSSSGTTSRGSSTTAGSTTSVSATSMSSEPSCGAPTSGGLALSNDYQTVLGYGGYCYAYSDSSQGCSPCGTSTACTSATQAVLCAAGVSAPTSGDAGASANYGSGFGCSLNQGGAVNGVAPAPQTFATSGSGVAYLLDRTPPPGTNLAIDDAGTEYFCPISAASGTCTWAMFGTTPGDATTNVTLTAAPSAAMHIHVQIDSGATSEAWSLCITSLSFIGTTTTLAGTGDPCVYDSDCASDLCDVTTSGDTGWCTVSCNYDSDCYGSQSGSVNAQGTSNYCVSTQGGTNYCFPGCASSVDCPFTGTSCTVVGVDEVCSQ